MCLLPLSFVLTIWSSSVAVGGRWQHNICMCVCVCDVSCQHAEVQLNILCCDVMFCA